MSDCTCKLSAFVSCFLLSAHCSCQLIALAKRFFVILPFLRSANCPLSSDCIGQLIALISWLLCQLIALVSWLLLSAIFSTFSSFWLISSYNKFPLIFWLLWSSDRSCQLIAHDCWLFSSADFTWQPLVLIANSSWTERDNFQHCPLSQSVLAFIYIIPASFNARFCARNRITYLWKHIEIRAGLWISLYSPLFLDGLKGLCTL